MNMIRNAPMYMIGNVHIYRIPNLQRYDSTCPLLRLQMCALITLQCAAEAPKALPKSSNISSRIMIFWRLLFAICCLLFVFFAVCCSLFPKQALDYRGSYGVNKGDWISTECRRICRGARKWDPTTLSTPTLKKCCRVLFFGGTFLPGSSKSDTLPTV